MTEKLSKGAVSVSLSADVLSGEQLVELLTEASEALGELEEMMRSGGLTVIASSRTISQPRKAKCRPLRIHSTKRIRRFKLDHDPARGPPLEAPGHKSPGNKDDEALRLERTASLLARARAWLRDEHVLAPADSVLRRAVGAARHKARDLLTDRSPLPPARRGAARSRCRRRRVAGQTAVNRARDAVARGPVPTWRTGRGATARRASSRPPSGTPG